MKNHSTPVPLNEEEINQLFEFVRSKYVPYRDVQMEIVDHLASAIEDLQAADPNLSFEEALRRTYAQFPITGFSKILAGRKKSLERYWMKVFGKHFVAYFKLPKMLLTLSIGLGIFSIIHWIGEAAAVLLYVIFIGSILFAIAWSMYQSYHHEEQREKYLIIQSFYSVFTSFITLIYSSFAWITVDQWISQSIGHNIFLSVIGSFCLILCHAYYFVFPDLLKQEINERYEHLGLKSQIST